MACLSKFTGNFTLDCGAPKNGPLMKPIGAVILNASDIVSFAIGGGGVATITRVPTTVGVPIETANGALTISVGLKGGEVAAQTYDVTAEMTLFTHNMYSASYGFAAWAGANASIVLAVNHGNGVYKVYGLGYPLECLSLEGDTTGNGFARATFGVEDWQVGTTISNIDKAAYDALTTPAPEPPKP